MTTFSRQNWSSVVRHSNDAIWQRRGQGTARRAGRPGLPTYGARWRAYAVRRADRLGGFGEASAPRGKLSLGAAAKVGPPSARLGVRPFQHFFHTVAPRDQRAELRLVHVGQIPFPFLAHRVERSAALSAEPYGARGARSRLIERGTFSRAPRDRLALWLFPLLFPPQRPRRRTRRRKPRVAGLSTWLRGRDSNPDYLIQSQASYH